MGQGYRKVCGGTAPLQCEHSCVLQEDALGGCRLACARAGETGVAAAGFLAQRDLGESTSPPAASTSSSGQEEVKGWP